VPSGGSLIACVRMLSLVPAFLVALIVPAFWAQGALADDRPRVVVVPLVNGTVSGWLVDFTTERNYMLNTYLEHLDALDRDPDYRLTVIEVPTLMAMKDLAPERFDQLRRHLESGHADLGSALYLNPTVSLTGGEALLRLGIEGIRWQEAEFGRRPRIGWMVDTIGLHRQMPQIASQLGIRGLIYARDNPTANHAYRWRSPDGSTVLAVGVGSYGGLPTVFTATDRLRREDVETIARAVQRQRDGDAPGVPTLILATAGDYGRPPRYQRQAGRLVEQWDRQYPDIDLVFGTPTSYLQDLEVAAERVPLIEYDGDTPYSLGASWVNIPRVKQGVRSAEHRLAAAEALSTVASLAGDVTYPAADLANGWINLLMNMDRGVLWGLGTGEVYESLTSWDVRDRFAAIDEITERVTGHALAAVSNQVAPAQAILVGATGAEAVTFFNPLSWERRDPVTILGTAGRGLAGEPCERLRSEDAVLCLVTLPPFGVRIVPLGDVVGEADPIEVTGPIETAAYGVAVDTRTGDLASLWSRSAGRELLGGPANVLVLERHREGVDTQDDMQPRSARQILGSTRETTAEIRSWRGPVMTTIEASQQLPEGVSVRRTLRLYDSLPRIDVETTILEVPSNRLVSVDFPLSGSIVGEDRGIPFGHASLPTRGGVHPAIRWSAVELADGSGIALLDRGIPGREILGNTAILPLLNAHDAYRGKPNAWLAGRGEHRFEYSLIPLDAGWREASIPLRAWERNAPPTMQLSATGGRMIPASRSWLRTSDNLIVESVRRVGREIEVRFAEWPGKGGSADVDIGLPSGAVYLTDALGEHRQIPGPGSPLRLAVRPQQIVTLRIEAPSDVPEVPPLLSFRTLVPHEKTASLETRHLLSGHPPE
jgi:alpha-mannosidase